MGERAAICVLVFDAPRIRSRQRKHHRVHNISSDVYWWSKPAPPSSEKQPGEKMQHHTHTHTHTRRALTLHDVLSSGNSSSRAVNWWTCDRVICHFYWQWLRIIWDEEWTLSLETNSPQFTQFKFNFLLPHQTAHAPMPLYPYVTKWRVVQLFASWFLTAGWRELKQGASTPGLYASRISSVTKISTNLFVILFDLNFSWFKNLRFMQKTAGLACSY